MSFRNSSQGTVAASDFYAQEMQTAAEYAAADLEREIRKDIETVCGDMLLEMCTAAGWICECKYFAMTW